MEEMNALFALSEGKIITTLDEEGILVVRINRENVMGALDPEASGMMEDVLNAAEKDAAVGAIILTGSLITAQRALELGMINYVVPVEEVMPKAMELARTIVANAPISLKLSKMIMHAAQQCSAEDTQRMCDIAWDYIEKPEDGVEGPLAFTEKRKPVWKNR